MKRYDFKHADGRKVDLHISEHEGDWVRYEDVEHLIGSDAAAAAKEHWIARCNAERQCAIYKELLAEAYQLLPGRGNLRRRIVQLIHDDDKGEAHG